MYYIIKVLLALLVLFLLSFCTSVDTCLNLRLIKIFTLGHFAIEVADLVTVVLLNLLFVLKLGVGVLLNVVLLLLKVVGVMLRVLVVDGVVALVSSLLDLCSCMCLLATVTLYLL